MSLSKEELLGLLRSFIEVLCQYDVVHNEMPLDLMWRDGDEDRGPIHGLACDDLKRIYIKTGICTAHKRQAVVHEFLHAIHYIKGDHDFLRSKDVEFLTTLEQDALVAELYDAEGQFATLKKARTDYKKRNTKNKNRERTHGTAKEERKAEES